MFYLLLWDNCILLIYTQFHKTSLFFYLLFFLIPGSINQALSSLQFTLVYIFIIGTFFYTDTRFCLCAPIDKREIKHNNVGDIQSFNVNHSYQKSWHLVSRRIDIHSFQEIKIDELEFFRRIYYGPWPKILL